MWKVAFFMFITHIFSKVEYLYNILRYMNLCLLFYVNNNLFSFKFQNSQKYQLSNKDIIFHKVLIDKKDETSNWNLLTYYKWNKDYNGMNLYDIKYFYPNSNIILLVYVKNNSFKGHYMIIDINNNTIIEKNSNKDITFNEINFR